MFSIAGTSRYLVARAALPVPVLPALPSSQEFGLDGHPLLFRTIAAPTGGVGHNLPQEAPHAFAQAVIDADGFLTGEDHAAGAQSTIAEVRAA